MQGSSPNSAVGEKEPKSNKALIIIVVVLVLLFLAIGSVMVFQARSQQAGNLTPTPTPFFLTY